MLLYAFDRKVLPHLLGAFGVLMRKATDGIATCDQARDFQVAQMDV